MDGRENTDGAAVLGGASGGPPAEGADKKVVGRNKDPAEPTRVTVGPIVGSDEANDVGQ
jgi:hypothetical protein